MLSWMYKTKPTNQTRSIRTILTPKVSLYIPVNSSGHVGMSPSFYGTSTQHCDVKTCETKNYIVILGDYTVFEAKPIVLISMCTCKTGLQLCCSHTKLEERFSHKNDSNGFISESAHHFFLECSISMRRVCSGISPIMCL